MSDWYEPGLPTIEQRVKKIEDALFGISHSCVHCEGYNSVSPDSYFDQLGVIKRLDILGKGSVNHLLESMIDVKERLQITEKKLS